MKAVILDAARPTTKGEKVAIISDGWLRLGDVADTLAIVSTLEVRAYFQTKDLEDVVNALEAVGAEVDVRFKEGH